MRDARRQIRPRVAMPTFVSCAVACLALTVAVGLQSPAVSGGVRWTPTPGSRGFEPIRLDFPAVVLPPRDARPGDGGQSWVAWALAVLVMLAVLIGIARWIRRVTRPVPPAHAVRTGGDAGAPGEADARVVQSGLASALQILSLDDRDLGNAVVQAWQGLEDAAAAAGVHRRPAETASEFTARILYRSRGSAKPIAVLLALYQRVRFGEYAPRADDIAAARHSLDVLVHLWRADLPGRRPTASVRSPRAS
ncbi:DUF4129 domain-containing protein [Roseisolibacter sp. H3M3-2]|nr:DUF4129 domain-containing protein [Roseisolibacter sp. H3M3-2]